MVEPDAFAQLLAYVEKETKNWRFCDIRLWNNVYWPEKQIANIKKILNDGGIARTNCVQEAVGLRPAFQRFCSIVEQHIDAMWILRKPTLEEVCFSRAAMENSVCGNVCRGFATRYPYEILNEQEREKWKQFEELICMDDRPVQQQFDRCSNNSIVSSKCYNITEISWKLCKSRHCLRLCVWVYRPQRTHLWQKFLATELWKAG